MTNATITSTNVENTNEGVSVLKSLRSLMPARVLSYPEALQRAEAQAHRLLTLHGISHGPVPIEIVTELPRLRVEQTYDLPVSGSAHWDGGSWVLTVNAAEFDRRQRFSVMHEFKHVIDHPTRHLIQGDRLAKLTAEQIAEKVADYFAACVLMPKAWVKSAFFNDHVRSVEALADMFMVSPKAMSFRLNQLGLTVPVDRCASPIARVAARPIRSYRSTPRPRRYHRALPTPDLALRGVTL
jgi:Zn-dependent peptidase ImmA (M78 family)